jgi:hypothetical protein
VVRQGLQRWAWAWIATGLAVMGGAGVRSSRWQNAWGEPQPACVVRGECSVTDIEPALRALWWWIAAGGVLVAAGLVLVAWRLGTERRQFPGGSPAAQAVASGTAGALLGTLLLPVVLVAAFLSTHALVAALAILWIVQAEVLAGLDRRYGTPDLTLRWAWSGALCVSGIAVLTVLGAVVAGSSIATWWAYPLLDGLVVGLLVAGARSAVRRSPAGPVPPFPERRPSAGVVVAVLATLSALAVLRGVQELIGPAWPQAVSALPEPRVTVPAPVPAPVEPPLPVPFEPPFPAPEPPQPVEASAPCAPGDLSFAVPAFDAAMGTRASNVQATNVGPAPCWVEGTPVVTLLQGGRPLTLTVEPGRTPSSEPAVVERVPLAPGDSAFAFLTWQTYAGWADAETPQTVTVALNPASPPQEVAVTGDFGPAPFDLADGGTWAIAPWAPPSWED